MICMEVMDISLDKFYMRAFASHKRAPQNQLAIPESILGKIAYSVRRIFILFRFRRLCYKKFICESMLFVGGEGVGIPERASKCDSPGCETVQHSHQSER